MEKRSVSKFKRFTITFISVVAILCLAVGVFCIIKNANNNTESLKSDIGALGSQIVGTTNSTGKNNSTSNSTRLNNKQGTLEILRFRSEWQN